MKKIKRLLNKILNNPSSITCFDADWARMSIAQKLEDLENRIIKLEDENVSLTNELYRLENSLDARIDLLTIERNT
jgi:hypothetical protein